MTKSLKEQLENCERKIVENALNANGGNRTKTAKILGVSRMTLFYKMRKYGLLEIRSNYSRQ